MLQEDAQDALDAHVRPFRALGDQIIGLDVVGVRSNIFSLGRDLRQPVVIEDHGALSSSWALAIVNFLTRGSVMTVADALRFQGAQLTAQQARSLDLCRPLYTLRPGEHIRIDPTPWQYGIASWYGPGFHGRLAASGEIYNMYDLTAAHRTLPLQTLVRVISRTSGRSVIVRISDRGPYIAGRNIDLSYRAKQELGMEGLAAVYLEVIDPRALLVSCR